MDEKRLVNTVRKMFVRAKISTLTIATLIRYLWLLLLLFFFVSYIFVSVQFCYVVFFFFSSLLFHSVRSHSVPAAKRSSLVCVLFFRRLTSNWAVDVRVLLENKKYKTRSMKTTSSSESWRAAAAWKKGEKKRWNEKKRWKRMSQSSRSHWDETIAKTEVSNS